VIDNPRFRLRKRGFSLFVLSTNVDNSLSETVRWFQEEIRHGRRGMGDPVLAAMYVAHTSADLSISASRVVAAVVADIRNCRQSVINCEYEQG
jgi:hypothetical protein